jgi:Fe-S cluster assembly protein SufD
MSSELLEHYASAQASQGVSTADWAASLRLQGMEAFKRAGFPTQRDEAWKYTSLRALERRRFLPSQGAALDAAHIAGLGLPLPDGPRLVFVNGCYLAAASDPRAMPGIRVSALSERLRADGGAAQTLLGRIADLQAHHFVALNTAFLGEGACIELAPEAELNAPIYLLFVSTPEAQAALVQPRVLIAAGRHARGTVVEHYLSAGDAANLSNVVTELALAEGASLEHYSLLEDGEADFHIAGLHARLERDSRLHAHSLSAGARLARHELRCTLAGEGAEVLLDGLFVAGSRRHTDQHLRIEHAVPHTRSRTDYRGVAEAHGRGVFGGKIVVQAGAQRTDAHQSSRNLLLGPQAEIDTRPELEIYADDVKCSHGATVGQLDAEALFYLRTRGFDAEHARALLTFAFAQDVIARCALRQVRARFAAALLGALPAAAALQELA